MIPDLATDGLDLLLAQGGSSLLALFWFVLFFELPRYTLPFIAAALSRNRFAAEAGSRGRLSVLLAGHNEAAAVRRCVRCLREQRRPPDEIVVVSDGSTDGMARELRALRDEGLIDQAHGTELRAGKAAAVNLAARLATGDVLVNLDCDCSLDRDALARIAAPFADPEVGAVAGNLAVRNAEASLVATFQAVEYMVSVSLGRQAARLTDHVTCVSGAFGAFRRSAFEEIGGLDAGGGEDLDFTLQLRKAGWRVHFAEDAICYTDVPTSLAALTRQRFRWERDAVRLRYRKHIDVMNPFSPRFRVRELLHELEFLAFNVLGAIAFPFYILWLFALLGTFAPAVLFAVQAGLLALDLATFALAAVVSPGASTLRLAPFVVGYSLFNGFVMRFVRLAAYLQEWIFEASYAGPYVPDKVHAARFCSMLRAIRRRPRSDNLVNQRRRGGGSAGRRIYLALLLVFGLGLLDYLWGDLVFLKANGLVLGERTRIAADFVARLTAVSVVEGQRVERGDVLLRVESSEMLERIADLAARRADLVRRAAEFRLRAAVIAETLPLAARREAETARVLDRFDRVAGRGLVTSLRYDEALQASLAAREERARLAAERQVLSGNIAALDEAERVAAEALADLGAHYAKGVIRAPATGAVGVDVPAVGEVFRPGEAMLAIHSGEAYVLAYLPSRYLFPIGPGMRVRVRSGRHEARGTVARILPVTGALPKEFQNAFKPQDRSQLATIRFAEPPPFPVNEKVTVLREGFPFGGTAAPAARPAGLDTRQSVAAAWRDSGFAPPPARPRAAATVRTPADRRDTRPVELAGRDVVRSVQVSLRLLGFDPGPADGVPGPGTRGAIRAFQDASGVVADGLVSRDLMARLAAGLATRNRLADQSVEGRR